MDLRARLGTFLTVTTDPIPMNVVVRSRDGEVVSLLVDRIDDIIRVSEEKFEAAPDT